MANRRASNSPRSTWITMRQGSSDASNSDSDNDTEALGGTAHRIFRQSDATSGPAEAFLRAYNRGELMHIRHPIMLGREGLHDEGANSNEDIELHDIYSDEHSDADMHIGMEILAETDLPHSEDNEDESDENDEGNGQSDEDTASWHISETSWPAVPSGRRTKRQIRARNRRDRQLFIPQYLEKTAYGALYQRWLAKRQQQDAGSDALLAGQKSAENGMTNQVAPDTFFQTLVQETWPHYCTPVPTESSLTGLRLGYRLGFGSQIRTESSHLSASSTTAQQPQAPPAAQHMLLGQGGQSKQRNGEHEAGESQALQLPSEWSEARTVPNLEVGADGVTVKYVGPGQHDSDAAMVLANASIPARVGVYYFEIRVVSRGQCGYIGVGLSRAGLDSSRLPGWDPGSWGYHGDDGHGFAGAGSGTQYGPRYSTGDTAGCGLDFAARRIFFTRNGLFLGYAFDTIDTSKKLFPTVGMRTPGEHIVANFGRKPFVFDIAAFVDAAQERVVSAVHAAPLQRLLPDRTQMGGEQLAAVLAQRERAGASQEGTASTSDAALGIVLQHLLHGEYYATARALLENAAGREPNAQLAEVLQTLAQQDKQRAARQRICRLVAGGEIDRALGLLQEAHPRVLEDETLVFQLRCRQFIELVRAASGLHIADCVPSDDGAALSDVMDVDDAQPAAMLSLAAVTSAPAAARCTKFGQLCSVEDMDAGQLVRALLEYGRQLQADYGSSPDPVIREGLVHTFSLLAYADPAQSPVRALLDPGACRPLARLVEMAMAAAENPPRMSALECICRQSATLLNELSTRGSGAAALLSLERDFLSVAGVYETDNDVKAHGTSNQASHQ
ncbi:hypothetical protein IWW36_003225 [Coemansia brasiliensis]|uniref:Uncharacterized protein n=1 Tax=Coemansia brasiliensis TaxID=2650707 RepID=A0A9W8IAJ6_9FUNG|nr:hypothetical protein IWW36_003225 [Coemansia brasiliensis]